MTNKGNNFIDQKYIWKHCLRYRVKVSVISGLDVGTLVKVPPKRVFLKLFNYTRNASSVQFSCWVVSLRPHGPQHARLPCPSPNPKMQKVFVKMWILRPHSRPLGWDSPGVGIRLFKFNRSVISNSLWCHGLQHPRLPCLKLAFLNHLPGDS